MNYEDITTKYRAKTPIDLKTINEGKSMDKSHMIGELHVLAATRLFGSDPWLAERDVTEALYRKFEELGLQKSISETASTTTPLGKELELDLIEVFAGAFSEFDVPLVLERYGLLSHREAKRIYRKEDLEKDAERVLRPIVQRAFLQRYNLMDRVH